MRSTDQSYDLCEDSLLREVPEIDGYKVLDPCILYSRIGRGGMGSVYYGRHLNLDLEVALKCMSPALADGDKRFIEMFRREARVAATITHPNLIRVYDVLHKYGLHYIIMSFVRGETARERVQRKGALDVREAVKIIYSACLGLYAAHKQNIVHRDIKPDNIMVSLGGEVKVADLGLSKAMNASETMTHTNQIMGTPQYMPPEQFHDYRRVGLPADVYALGATLYFLIAGQDAITPGSLVEVMRAVCDSPFPKIQQSKNGVGDEIARIIDRCTEPEEGNRYKSAGYLARALKDASVDLRIDLKDPAAGTVVGRATVVSPPPQRTVDKIRSHLETGELVVGGGAGWSGKVATVLAWLRRPVVMGVLGGLLVVAVGFIVFRPSDDREDREDRDDRSTNQDRAVTEVGEEILREPEIEVLSDDTRLVLLMQADADLDGVYERALRFEQTPVAKKLISELEGKLVARLEESVKLRSPSREAQRSRAILVEGTCTAIVKELHINRVSVELSVADELDRRTFSKELQAAGDGDFPIEVEVVDRHRMSFALQPRIVTIDGVAPVVSVTSPETVGWIAERSITISGTAEDNDEIESVTVREKPADLSDGGWSCSLRVPDGVHSLTIKATDRAGNETAFEQEVRVDATDPTIWLVDPSGDEIVFAGQVVVRGEVKDTTETAVSVNDVAAAVTDGAWTANVSLAVGESTLTIVAVDQAGNRSTKTRTLTVNAPRRALDWAIAKEGTSYDPKTGMPLEVVHEKTKIELTLISGDWLSTDAISSGRQERGGLRPFYIGTYEVTIEQYNSRRLLSGTFYESFRRDITQPMVNITWNQAKGFSRRLGPGFRLPTEVEWEVACRGGNRTEYSWGSDARGGDGFANVFDKTGFEKDARSNRTARKNPSRKSYKFPFDDGFSTTSPVGSFKPNGFGLYDMIGNAAEWCDGGDSEHRPLRGGSWISIPTKCGCAFRDLKPSVRQGTSIGFRVCRDAEVD